MTNTFEAAHVHDLFALVANITKLKRKTIHKKGLSLAKRIKEIMGPNGKVIYFKEADYSSTQKSKEILIQDEKKAD